MKKEYNIQKLSKITSVPSTTIRYYENLNILMDVKRDNNNYRIFSQEHVVCLNVIKKLKEIDLSIEQIVEISKLYENKKLDKTALKEILNKQLKFLENQKQALDKKQKLIKNMLENNLV